ncbi:MAG: Rrf2 family transcriptional regulator [Deltaproteobacteria bacterium]|nr:MAG: Rrf2 family transcriptional regulator [Deltaproteobacteria bacterium]
MNPSTIRPGDPDEEASLFAKTSHYALRLMTCLAREAGDALVPSRELAERAAVPAAYISKVMRRLEEAELVFARKGRGGGFRLSREPSAIHLMEILRAVDEPGVSRDECVFGWGACRASDPCPLHATWSLLGREVDAWADRTLADVVAREGA